MMLWGDDPSPIPTGVIGWIITAVMVPLAAMLGIIVRWQMTTITSMQADAKSLAETRMKSIETQSTEFTKTIVTVSTEFAKVVTAMTATYVEANEKRNQTHQQTIDSILKRHQEMQAAFAEHCERENLRVAAFFGWEEGGSVKPK